MCGIAGFWPSDRGNLGLADSARRMTGAIEHRGPDDDGVWSDESCGATLGFRRLAILDLSPAGHQPMPSNTGRYMLVFNGEMYNFRTLRDELRAAGATFRSGSDTEVLLAGFDAWGIVDTVKRAAGMFAMAIFDRERRELHLVRDRLGEKPMYYGVSRGTLLYGSELKALRAHPSWSGQIDRSALALFLRHNYVPAPYSIYKGIRKVVPGTIVTFSSPQAEPIVTTYWSALEVAERGSTNPADASDEEMESALDSLLRRVVGDEMVADVPLGAFLSGGVDSSALVALMQAQSSVPVKTFTIGFNEHAYNEAQHAAAVAAHLGTDHTELYVTAEDTLAVVPKLPTIYDEPFADSSQIPTFLVAQLARTRVTVSLSGEGGDELFGGYNRYFWGERLWNRLSRVPRPARAALGRSLRSVSPGGWDAAFSAASRVLPRRLHAATPGTKVHKVASFMGAQSSDALYRGLMTHWRDPEAIAGAAEPPTVLTSAATQPSFSSVVNRMRYFDMVSELPDDILVKVDRAAMAVSLESRAPFLHQDVVEFAWRIPLSQQLRDGQGKWLLRQVLYRYVPKALIERPKMGFGVPIDQWLRGPLKEWAETLLSRQRLESDGYLAPAMVRTAWDEHQSRSADNSHMLWGALMFGAWLEADRAS